MYEVSMTYKVTAFHSYVVLRATWKNKLLDSKCDLPTLADLYLDTKCDLPTLADLYLDT